MQRISAFRAVATATTILFSAPVTQLAKAAPPQVGTEAYGELSPYGPDIKGMKQPGNSGVSCCDLTDCRRVDAHINREGHYVARIPRANKETGEGFDGGDNKDYVVPDVAVVPADQRPVIPFDLACWAKPTTPFLIDRNGFFCFTPKLMTQGTPPRDLLLGENRKSGPLHYPEHAATKANLTTPSTAAQSPSRNPLNGCVYGVAKDNKIARGLENVIAVSQAGAGYNVGDVFYKLEKGFFIVARGATSAYRVQGEIPPQAIANGVRLAPLFIQECRSMPKARASQPLAKPAP